jgi:hypothetical protein
MPKGKRELIEPQSKDKRFVRRDDKGQFSKVSDAGKSLARDVKQPAKRTVPKGQGDRGDQKR